MRKTKKELQNIAENEYEYGMGQFWDSVNESTLDMELTDKQRDTVFDLIADLIKKY